MSLRAHLKLLSQALAVWLAFFLAGLPAYYQQYSGLALAIGSLLIQLGMSLWAIAVLQRGRPQSRMRRACWIALYFTVPFAMADSLYCGWHLGFGADYLLRYWYLSVFYLTPWLTFPPTAWLLTRGDRSRST